MGQSVTFSPGDGAVSPSDRPPWLWVNGERQHRAGPHISAWDRGFTLGDGVFETMCAHNGVIFRLDRHLARLCNALGTLDILPPPQLREWVFGAMETAGTASMSVRLTVSRGAGPGGLAPPANPRPTVVISVQPLAIFPPAVYETGLTAHVASGRRNERAITAGLKTLAFTESIAAWIEAQRAGASEALFLDTEGHCSEATSSNLFIWSGSALLTPPVSCGALPGITRAAVLELAAAVLGVPAAERIFGPAELIAAEEAFLTSSLRGVAPLVRVDERPIGRGVPGEVTRKFVAAYSRLVDRECGRQAAAG